MKKHTLLVLIGALALVFSTASAQQPNEQLRTEAMETTRQLAAKISLDDARTVQVRRLTYDRLVKESEVNTLYSDDAVMRQNKLRVIGEEYAEKLKGVLTEAQYQRYAATLPPAPVAEAATAAPTKAQRPTKRATPVAPKPAKPVQRTPAGPPVPASRAVRVTHR